MKLAMKPIDPPSIRLFVQACGLFTLLALAAPALVAQNAAQPVSSVRLTQHTPHKVVDGTAVRVGHYEPTQMLRLAIFVTPRDLAGQEKLLADLQDKKSPNFHKWLTAEQWNARFGPRVEDEQAVVDWAKSQGLTVTNRYANRMLVDVEAPSGVIEQALGVTINHYQVGDEVDFSNDRDPAIPAHLSGIVGGIFGLNSIERVKPASSQRTEARHPDYVPGPVFNKKISGRGEGDPSKAPWVQESGVGNGGAALGQGQPAPVSSEGSPNPNPNNELGGINPENLYSSQGYDLGALMSVSKCCNVHNDTNGSPADTSIALVTFGGFKYSDYTAFTTYYGMAWNIDAYQIDGAASTSTTDCQIDVSAPGSGCPGDGTDDEADLDVEWSTAFANSYGSSNDTAHVYVYEGSAGYFSNWFDVWNYVLSDAHAHVISTSYAWTEEGQQSGDPGWMTGTVNGDAHYVFNALVAQGNTLIAAAGDQGATSGCSNADQVFWPANDPDFLAAGGTSLTLNYDGSFGSETAWVGGSTLKDCQNNGGGGGGGISQYFSAPSWQSGITYEEMDNGNDYVVSNQPNRMMPDFSLNATGNFQWDYCTTSACKNTSPNGWATWGGTSIVAPELAGFYAQVNSYLNSIGHICGSGTSACEPIGNPDPILYYEGMGQGAPHNPFYDTNQLCVTNYLTAQNSNLLYFCATSGYDLATGWGSANLLQLAWAYNYYIIPSYGVPSVKFSGPATSTWFNTDQIVSWTVSDGVTSNSTTPAPGVAGFTQGWDSIPADPYSEPNGGSGNSFYSGPQYPYGKTGCLAFNGAGGCSGNPGQGCHTVNVGAWDNQGYYTGAQTYGPVCYDTVAPTIAIDTNVSPDSGGWFNIATGNPYVSLVATDPGGSNASGVKTIYGVLGPTSCSPTNLGTCQIYGPPFQILQGPNPITAFSLDNAGNFSNVAYTTLWLDTVAPVTTDSLVGQWNNGTSTTAVTVTLNATDATSGVETTYYTLNGGSTNVYSGPFLVSTAGSNTLKYWSVDWANNTEAKNTATFAIQSPTTAVVVATPSPSMVNQSVKITATVTATLTGTPTGSVQFWNGATSLGTSTLSGGVASITTTALPAGLLTLQASFLGSTYYAATNSPPFDQTVNENTTTTVTASPNPSVYGQSFTLTAQVTPTPIISGTPTGSVTFYYLGSPLGVGTVNGSGVASITSSLPAGANQVAAAYSGDSVYLSSSSTLLTVTVNPAPQTITFPAIATQYATTSVGLSATASSGLTVTYASTTPTVCSVSGTTASLLISGSCTIEATQTGNGNYSAAPPVYRAFWVNLAHQTITFPAISTQTVLTSVGLSATASSDLTVSFASTTPTVCSVAAGATTASLLTIGTCTIHATQAGNTTYSAAPAVNTSFTVVGLAQTITFPTIATQYAASKVSLTATASSGLTVTYASTTPTVCTVSGTTASLLISGGCTIEAMQTGSSIYAAATPVYRAFWVNLAHQTITFPTIPPQVEMTSVPLSATASSGLAVSFASTTPSICTVSGTTASLLIPGTCTIQATQAGNSTTYNPAPAVNQSFTVRTTQTITFPAIAVQYALASVSLSATASSGLAVTYASTTPTVCSVSGTTASLLISGSCTIEAMQAGNGAYAAAPVVYRAFWVNPAHQTIAFPNPGPQSGVPSLSLSATASSGLTVSFASTTPTVCTVAAGGSTTASLLIGGTCTIQATQTGNATYASAPAVNQSFTVTAP
jgi:hypothetical protein